MSTIKKNILKVTLIKKLAKLGLKKIPLNNPLYSTGHCPLTVQCTVYTVICTLYNRQCNLNYILRVCLTIDID